MEDNEELKELLESVRYIYGYDFTEYTEASVKRRVTGFMNNNKIGSLSALGKVLLKEDEIFEKFVQEITVNVTEMFRDPTFYKSLRENIIMRLGTYPFIKVW